MRIGEGGAMRSRIVIGMVLVSLTIAAGCGDDSDSASDVTTTEPTSASSTDGRTTELIGSWHRAQTCAEMLAAF
jgi:ABC-type glycerol-3-phosphate transport system substrate-binding protein